LLIIFNLIKKNKSDTKSDLTQNVKSIYFFNSNDKIVQSISWTSLVRRHIFERYEEKKHFFRLISSPTTPIFMQKHSGMPKTEIHSKLMCWPLGLYSMFKDSNPNICMTILIITIFF
jgi:hypothetical protein